MASDWSKPTVTDNYGTLVPNLNTQLSDLLKGLEPAATGSHTNVPTGAIRWNASAAKWQIYNGSAWVDLSSTYAINISGNAGTATVSDDTTTSGTMYPLWASGTSGAQAAKVSSTKLTFNPASGVLSATAFSGSGASLTNLNGSNIASGTVPAARLGSGTPSSSTFLRGDSTWADVPNINSSSEYATTSGTAVSTGSIIPSSAKRVHVLLNAISTNASAVIVLQMTVGGSPETSGYNGRVSAVATVGTDTQVWSSGIRAHGSASLAAADSLRADICLHKVSGNTWLITVLGYDAVNTIQGGGTKTLAGALDGFRLTTAAGTASFDAGSMVVTWE